MINKIIANDLGVVMEIQKFTNNATTSADMLRRYQDMIVENQGDEDLEEATDDNEDQVDEAQEEVEEGKLPPGLQAHIDAKNDKEVDEAKDEDEKEEVKEEIPSTSMLRRYQDMIKEAEKEDEEVDESKEEDEKEEVDEGGEAGTRLGSSSITTVRDPKTGKKSYSYAQTKPHDGHTDSVYGKGEYVDDGTSVEDIGKDIQKYYTGPDAYKKGPGKFPSKPHLRRRRKNIYKPAVTPVPGR
jgi:hypothetical protein